MNPLPKFLPLFALSYVGLTVLGGGTTYLLARLGLIETVSRDLSALFLVLTWCIAVEIAARDGTARARYRKGKLDTKRTVAFVLYHQGLVARRGLVALAAAGFGLLFHLVIAGAKLHLTQGAAFFADIPLGLLAVQGSVFWVLAYICLPSPPRRGGGGPGFRVRGGKEETILMPVNADREANRYP